MIENSKDFIPATEEEKTIIYSAISPNDFNAIMSYIGFEDDNQFEREDSNAPTSLRAEKLKRKIEAGDTAVLLAYDGNEIIGSSSLADLRPDSQEAWADGILVRQDCKRKGIGTKLVFMQEQIAREAGKDAIITAVNIENSPSIGLWIKNGYILEGANHWKSELSYKFRKDLKNGNSGQIDWAARVLAGGIKFFDSSGGAENHDDQLLIEVTDFEGVKNVLASGHKGVYLLTPEDFPDEKEKPINKNCIVFVKD